jgi:hypothetical protein
VVEQPQDGPESTQVERGLVARFSRYAATALRYWEPRRFAYNGVLGLVVLAHFFHGLPGSRDQLSFDLLLGLFLLAVLANIAYCAAYVADLFVQFSGLDAAWRRGRTVLLTVGIAFAATIAHFFAKAIFGP